ncbi:MAG: VOC family protein [bacterium]|nr:VOC family protein [bacterium]
MAHPVVHFEIGCKDGQQTQDFYSKLFDWKIAEMGPARMIDTGDKVGIQGHISSLGHEPHQYVTVYVQVEDINACLAKASQLGGKTLVPATPIPGMGEFAWLSDPGGNIIGLWTSISQ